MGLSAVPSSFPRNVRPPVAIPSRSIWTSTFAKMGFSAVPSSFPRNVWPPVAIPSRNIGTSTFAKMDLSAVPSSFPRNVRPPIAIPSRSIWTSTFASVIVDPQVQERYRMEIEVLKEEVKSMLETVRKGSNNHVEKLVLADTLERLGIAYHFEQEIHELIDQIHKFHGFDEQDYDLFTTALRFRLLRQHRFHVSCGVFEKFKDEFIKLEMTGNNSEMEDAKGLLSLYEATQVRVNGEEIFDEGVKYSIHHLKLVLPKIKSPLQDQVKRVLEDKMSIQRGIPRVETRFYISIYDQLDDNNSTLIRLAKLDFNYLQNLYRQELSELIRWWKKVDLNAKLPYLRDRVVKAYIWSLAFRFEPQYSNARLIYAKVLKYLTVMDDTYDNYATLDEANLLNEAFQRWDIKEIDVLQDYMKIVYKFILQEYEEFKEEATKQGKPFAVHYAIEAVKEVSRAFHKELEWFRGAKMMPTFEEYMANTEITGCIKMMYSIVVPSMKSVSEESIKCFTSEPRHKMLVMQTTPCDTYRTLSVMTTRGRMDRY